MSIATSKEERDQAKAKVGATPVEQLEHDLAYWSVAKVDHQARYVALTQERQGLGELFAEADTWIDIIAAELAARRKRPT